MCELSFKLSSGFKAPKKKEPSWKIWVDINEEEFAQRTEYTWWEYYIRKFLEGAECNICEAEKLCVVEGESLADILLTFYKLPRLPCLPKWRTEIENENLFKQVLSIL